jgi:hypothetical protein
MLPFRSVLKLVARNDPGVTSVFPEVPGTHTLFGALSDGREAAVADLYNLGRVNEGLRR